MALRAAETELGGKATALSELVKAGLRVPEFGVITAESEPVAGLIEQLGFPLAVRSSAAVEDGEHCSFAGQFASFLNLRSIDEVQAAVRKCFDSARSSPAIVHCRLQGGNVASPRMSVIVQRMVEPQLAGVAFTVCPNTGAERVVVEACEGLGDQLLQGRASPLPADHPLLAKHLPQIDAACRQIQRHFGRPQDIEFAVANDLLYILQSRPITRIEFAGCDGEWTSANFREGGVSSGVCSPLMWSLYEFVWNHALKQSLREIGLYRGEFLAARMIFGRPYWNLGAVKEAVARIPGFAEREFDDDLCIPAAYDGEGRRTPVSVATVLRALPVLLALPRFLRRQVKDAQLLLDQFDALAAAWESINRLEANLRRLVERDYLRIEGTYFRTVFAVSLAKLEFKKLFPGCDYAGLMAALPELSHLAPVRHMKNLLARDEEEAREVAVTYRHHCRWGIDIRHPRWDEDLEFVSQLLAQCQPPAEQDARVNFARARTEAMARLPWWKRPLFTRRLDRLRRLVWLREELRDLSGQMYYLIRRRVLAIAKTRGLGEDIFFQTFQEIEVDDRRQIHARREIFECYRNFQPPSVIGGESRWETNGETAGSLRGIGASGGIALGVAHIANNPAEALRAEAGAVLICPFVEPGWTVVLARVAGLVTEIGGRLSHAAVICRELGIPAVLGVPDATRRIRAGQQVTIDGRQGLVGIQEGAASARSPA